METPQHQRDRFVAAYDDVYDDVLRFVQRRLASGAEDVVAEAMTAAWRRADELPVDPGDARAWLFGIARNCLLNHRRGLRRQGAVAVRLAQATADTTKDQADEVALRTDLARAWAALSPTEQEVLALAVLDGLSSQQCIFEVPHLERTMGATGGWASVDSPAPAPLGARGLETHGGGGFVGSAGGYAMSVGRVGNRVTAVTVHTNGRAVTATVSNGHYVAWWPVEELTPSPDEHYDLTLADGTVLRDVTPRG